MQKQTGKGLDVVWRTYNAKLSCFDNNKIKYKHIDVDIQLVPPIHGEKLVIFLYKIGDFFVNRQAIDNLKIMKNNVKFLSEMVSILKKYLKFVLRVETSIRLLSELKVNNLIITVSISDC